MGNINIVHNTPPPPPPPPPTPPPLPPPPPLSHQSAIWRHRRSFWNLFLGDRRIAQIEFSLFFAFGEKYLKSSEKENLFTFKVEDGHDILMFYT